MWLTRSVCRPGNDPLIDEESNHDINSVAGVLKLYFRGLENPLFPKDRFNDVISCVREYNCLFQVVTPRQLWPDLIPAAVTLFTSQSSRADLS